jgi:hypothetical protein
MMSNRALANFKTHLATTMPRDRGYLSAANQHGFRTPARPVGAYDAASKRAIRARDFERGGALDDSPMKQDYEALISFLQDRLSDADQREVHGLIENLMNSCGPDSENAEDAIDPATGLPPGVRPASDYRLGSDAARGPKAGSGLGLDARYSKGAGSTAKAEADFRRMFPDAGPLAAS